MVVGAIRGAIFLLAGSNKGRNDRAEICPRLNYSVRPLLFVDAIHFCIPLRFCDLLPKSFVSFNDACSFYLPDDVC